jgi:adenylate cyclase class 2
MRLLIGVFMKEIEVKILNVNKKEVEKRLLELGAEKNFNDNIDAIYYDIEQPNENDKKTSLRLRQKGDIVEFTYKHRTKTKKIKIADEYEVKVSDFEEMKKILKALGYKITKNIKKHRTAYNIDNIHFELDTYPGEPTLLEIEAPTTKQVEKYVKLLGYDMKVAKGWSFIEVLEYYKNKCKRN